MQSLNVTCVPSIQLEKLLHKFLNFSMVNYDSLKEEIRQNDKNYPFVVPTWLIILITVSDTFMTATGIASYCYCNYRQPRNKPKIFPTA